MSKLTFAPVRLVAAGLICIMSVMLGIQAISAQGAATPADDAAITSSHPAHIHTGTCENLGDVVFPLNNVTPLGVDVAPATPIDMTSSPAADVADTAGTPMPVGVSGTGMVTAESTSEVEASLDDILAGEHAINVHESDENIQNYIACGDLTGTPEDGQLQIELMELNNSGYSGEAVLLDNGDGTTTVTITLMETGADVSGTPVASPAG